MAAEMVAASAGLLEAWWARGLADVRHLGILNTTALLASSVPLMR